MTSTSVESQQGVDPLDEYLDRPYHFVLVNEPDQRGTDQWTARVAELPGTIAQGSTPEAALGRAKDAMAAWIETAIEDGQPVPIPETEERYSGKFLMRVARSLHRRLADAAKDEGVSLNQFVSSALAAAVAWPTGATPRTEAQQATTAPSATEAGGPILKEFGKWLAEQVAPMYRRWDTGSRYASRGYSWWPQAHAGLPLINRDPTTIPFGQARTSPEFVFEIKGNPSVPSMAYDWPLAMPPRMPLGLGLYEPIRDDPTRDEITEALVKLLYAQYLSTQPGPKSEPSAADEGSRWPHSPSATSEAVAERDR